MKDTGEIKEVERNQAHELVDSGEGEIMPQFDTRPTKGYNTREMKPTQTKTK